MYCVVNVCKLKYHITMGQSFRGESEKYEIIQKLTIYVRFIIKHYTHGKGVLILLHFPMIKILSFIPKTINSSISYHTNCNLRVRKGFSNQAQINFQGL